MCNDCEDLCGLARIPDALMLRVSLLRALIMVDGLCCQSTEGQLQDAVAEDGILIYYHLAESKFLIMREQDASSYKLEMKRLCKCTRGGDILYPRKGAVQSVSGVEIYPLLLESTIQEQFAQSLRSNHVITGDADFTPPSFVPAKVATES